MSKDINEVKLSGMVAQSPKAVSDKLYKFTIETTEINDNGRQVHAFIPVASSEEVAKGDLVEVTGRITTASTHHEDGTWSNYWNVLANTVENKGQVEVNDDSYNQYGAGSDWLNRQKVDASKQQVKPNHYEAGGYESKWEKEAKADYQKRLHDAEAKIDNGSSSKELTPEEKDSAIAAARAILAKYGE